MTSETSGHLLDDEVELTLAELCRACQLSTEQVLSLIEEGVIEPQGAEPMHWRFQAVCVKRVRRASRLEQDLGVNPAGAALILDLVEELDRLRLRLRRLEQLHGEP